MNDITFILGIVAFKALIVWLGISMAKTKNRNVYTWAVIVFLFSIVGIIVLLLLPKVSDQTVADNVKK